MPGQPIDWRRAKHPRFVEIPLEEISHREAVEDQDTLKGRTAAAKKRRKYVRSTPQERVLDRLMEKPETAQERRLKTVLASLSRGKNLFQLTASTDASCRLFERRDVKLRVKIDPSMRGQLIALSPGEPVSFEWITAIVAPGALEDQYASFLAARLRELISKQNQLQQAKHG